MGERRRCFVQNYQVSSDDSDDDFSCDRAPSAKKKTKLNSRETKSNATAAKSNSRPSLDEKLFERQLRTAIEVSARDNDVTGTSSQPRDTAPPSTLMTDDRGKQSDHEQLPATQSVTLLHSNSDSDGDFRAELVECSGDDSDCDRGKKEAKTQAVKTPKQSKNAKLVRNSSDTGRNANIGKQSDITLISDTYTDTTVRRSVVEPSATQRALQSPSASRPARDDTGGRERLISVTSHTAGASVPLRLGLSRNVRPARSLHPSAKIIS